MNKGFKNSNMDQFRLDFYISCIGFVYTLKMSALAKLVFDAQIV